MGALSDSMLATGCVPHIEAIHGEEFEILSGPNAGQKFKGVREIVSDQILATDLGEDPRDKIMLHIPSIRNVVLPAQGRIRSEDGRQWTAVRQPQSHLTDDYELIEFIPDLDA